MLLEIYLTMIAVGFVLMGLSFYTRIAQHEIILIPFLCAIVFLFLGYTSLTVITPFCTTNLVGTSELSHEAFNATDKSIVTTSISSNSWSCYEYLNQDTSMSWFFYGLGILMLGYAIITTITAGGDMIENPGQQN